MHYLFFLLFICPFINCELITFTTVNPKYHLVSEGYNLAKDMFLQERANYEDLKVISLQAIDTFLDLVSIMNQEMAKILKSTVTNFYKTKYFKGFTKYAISFEEIIDIMTHCLKDPSEKLDLVRRSFQSVIKNFEDVRDFSAVEKCREDMPDEVATAHCILHQAVLFNETMQDSLITIVKIKTRQHAQDMNDSLYYVQKCFNDFVPNFFQQLQVNVYTDNCSYLKIIKVSIDDLLKDQWEKDNNGFLTKWEPLVKIFKEKLRVSNSIQDSLLMTLIQANLTSPDIYKTLFK